MGRAKKKPVSIEEALAEFASVAEPLEPLGELKVLTDRRTGAQYCECHITAKKLIELATVDSPLDPEDQGEYRANREIVTNHQAFRTMQEDAKQGRSFSNIVAEYSKDFDAEHPIKIIGGQHRFKAISEALTTGVNEQHGIKLYFLLNMEQRLDVQLISNTNIAVASDLFDRMQETIRGPELRDWCQQVGFLDPQADFADKRERGGRMTVQLARTFITNYYGGKAASDNVFTETNTVPVICPSGEHDFSWEELKGKHSDLWTDAKLKEAATQFSALVKAQRDAFKGEKKPKADYPEKALSIAILSAWPYVAGLLHQNQVRLSRHFDLSKAKGKDPLNAAALTKGRHKSDPENYRGLGYRTDPKERGRFVELFYLQAERGAGITPGVIEHAIALYFVKQAMLEALKSKEKL